MAIERSGKYAAVAVRLDGGLRAMEDATNEVGCFVSEDASQRFDPDSSGMQVAEINLTARGRDPKEYRTR